MPFYYGKSADGSDIKEWEGVYVNPDNPEEWSSEPYPEQKREIRKYWAVRDYMNGKYRISDVRKQILDKTCTLPRSLRDYVMSLFDENGNLTELV